jgi:hypothetical protein
MLKIRNQEYFDSVVKFAEDNGLKAELQEQLDYLANYGGTPDYTECVLFRDFAPQSFQFELLRKGQHWMSGGLIFHGPHDNGGDGGMPTLSVSLNPDTKPHWQVHT